MKTARMNIAAKDSGSTIAIPEEFRGDVLAPTMAGDLQASLKDVFGNKLQSVILFGSYARGDYDEESDIDVAVTLDMPRQDIRRFRKDVAALMSSFALKYDKLVSITEIPAADYAKFGGVLPFYRNIAQEGMVLYAG